jgi:hypothetical protein
MINCRTDLLPGFFMPVFNELYEIIAADESQIHESFNQ